MSDKYGITVELLKIDLKFWQSSNRTCSILFQTSFHRNSVLTPMHLHIYFYLKPCKILKSLHKTLTFFGLILIHLNLTYSKSCIGFIHHYVGLL